MASITLRAKSKAHKEVKSISRTRMKKKKKGVSNFVKIGVPIVFVVGIGAFLSLRGNSSAAHSHHDHTHSYKDIKNKEQYTQVHSLIPGATRYTFAKSGWTFVDIRKPGGGVVKRQDGNPDLKADVLIWGAGYEYFNWNKYKPKVHHKPGGHTEESIKDLISKEPNATDLILTTGYLNALYVLRKNYAHRNEAKEEVESIIKNEQSYNQKMKVHIENTKDAVKLFNELVSQGKKPIGAFHFTC